MILGETPRRQRVSKLVSWGHWFALANILIAIVIASIYVFNSSLPNSALGMAYLLSNWFSHIAFLTFLGFVLFVLPLCYILPNVNLVKGLSSVLAAVGLALLAFDALLYNKHGLHLSLGSADLIRNETKIFIASFSWQQWSFLGLLFVVWLSFQLMLANGLWKRIERFQKKRIGLPIVSFFVICFSASHGAHIWADANLYQPIVKQDDMFPLSYPATAKTLLSKYDLLDIQNYQRRKELQLESQFTSAVYPTAPVYCGIDNQANLVLLVGTQDKRIGHLGSALDLHLKKAHFDIAGDQEDARFSILYGLPSLYRDVLSNQRPVPLDLTQKLGLPTMIYSAAPLPEGVSTLQVDWDTFAQVVPSTNPKLAIGFVDEEQMNLLLAGDLHKNSTLLLTRMLPNKEVALLSNIDLTDGDVPSSHEDLLPTLMHFLGCQAPSENYSTGQSLLSSKRKWLVSNSNGKIVLIEGQTKTEVDSQGNYKLYDLPDGEESAKPLNMNRLSQGIKHLSRFAQQP
ncbi:DUF3413 domain-containing protein [Aliiglaciecola sp. CAU 1673]|uniref:DUF3413 domain-containing protein n=1 Tax=Aliiglaciecola sp. CAU 1673 TaxID=3032595 RepID=UPI0023DA8847|nr:DUF3413 domain-containing protein [Aliiglaciecola sp. CAU 1673]MDF2177694.1 DUF3413 domain-containing protein [Aliiglaciecola sp. CAU 1673]